MKKRATIVFYAVLTFLIACSVGLAATAFWLVAKICMEGFWPVGVIFLWCVAALICPPLLQWAEDKRRDQ